MRLDLLLAKTYSRKAMKQALHQRKITVDGVIAQHLSQNVDTNLQEVIVNGIKLTEAPHHYFIVNKPAGVVTANSDTHHQTVMDLLKDKDYNSSLYAVGRLDRDTRGLLLITDNGPLGFQLLHPDYHISKTYFVIVNGLLTIDDVKKFQQGITFYDGTVCKPAELLLYTTTTRISSATITITEGKFHQIKKMFLCVGKKVTYLQRIQFGELTLEQELKEGEYRPLHKKELAIIKSYLEKTR